MDGHKINAHFVFEKGDIAHSTNLSSCKDLPKFLQGFGAKNNPVLPQNCPSVWADPFRMTTWRGLRFGLFSKKWSAPLFALCLLPFALKSQPAPAFSIDELEKRTFNFFWETADANFQTPDRWPTVAFSSIAATGFGLSANLVGVERGYVTREQAAERTLKTLAFLKNLPQGDAATGMGGFHGFFYHFLDHQKGHRFKDVELSTIDSGLLMAGALSAQTYFDGENPTETAIRNTAQQLYDRVEWDWMLNSNYRISMGWKPESGFLSAEWAGYNEAMLLYFLALGSPTHMIPVKSWTAWTDTYYYDEFLGQPHVNFGPLFGHQYSHVWVDFRGINDPYMTARGFDYFENSRRATLSNQAFCVKNQSKFPHFNEKIWGLTACDGPTDWFWKNKNAEKTPCADRDNYDGYSARGAASDYETNDGTIAPTAAGGSIPFAPGPCVAALDAMWTTYGDSLVGKYGFKDAFNPGFTACGQLPGGWFDTDYLGIDQGPILLMLENWRSGFLWNLMKKNPNLVRGMKRAGFSGGWLENAEPKGVKKTSPAFVNQQIPTDLKTFFAKKIFRDAEKLGGTPLPYRLLNPPKSVGLTSSHPLTGPQSFPLVIFLHGSGERGLDNESQLKNGALNFAEPDFQKKHPCFVLIPQCPNDAKWHNTTRDDQKVTLDFDKPSAAGLSLLALIDSVLAKNPTIDRDRIYLTGLSMGGHGTFEMLMRRPGFFAAAMPVCGGADLRYFEKIKDVPLRFFHGANDAILIPKYSRDLFDVLKKSGSRAEYVEFPAGDHDIWNTVYDDDANLDWLFLHKK